MRRARVLVVGSTRKKPVITSEVSVNGPSV